jgi:glutamyl-tRNA synthetase
MTKEVRTRFAPSPTGFLHVGGVRTALFAYLLAKRHNGKFILRLEDTDQQRIVPGAIRSIIQDLVWLGVVPDEGASKEELLSVDPSLTDIAGFGGSKGPYIQSLRKARYQEVADILLASGHAYKSDAAQDPSWMERKAKPGATVQPTAPVEEKPGEVIRLRLPRDRKLSYTDGIRGFIEWESLSLNDPVLIKSDGFPTYHLAVVVDDHDMEISHVIRGEEWIPTTPIHLALYEALGWEKPIFAHPSSVLGEDGKKLSKRHGATSVGAFQEEGYLPEALLNFLVLIGWSPGSGNDQEIFSKEELIELFSLEKVHQSAGVFSYKKLNWMNAQYVRNMTDKVLADRLIPILLGAGHTISEPAEVEKLVKIVPHIKERMERLTDAPVQLEFLFKQPFERDMGQMLSKQVQKADISKILAATEEKFAKLATFDAPAIDTALKEIVEELGLPMGGVFICVRVALLGKKATPPLAPSIEILGSKEALKRIEEAKLLAEKL